MISSKPRGLLLDAYDAGSHRRWRQGIEAHIDADWTVLTLPPRHFLWRAKGSPLWWATEERRRLEQPYDVVLAASTVDISTLRGLVPALGSCRTVVYFHENQVAYPSQHGRDTAGLAIGELYNLMAADAVAFNSNYNRDSLFDGLAALLKRLPDHIPRGVLTALQAKCSVLPVPLEERCFLPRLPRQDKLQILWNHRWEYDKAPERFFAALSFVHRPYVLHVAGQQFRKQPDAFTHVSAAIRARAETWGFVQDADEYQRLLQRADVVVSTALHEFQGLAVLEAMAAGCQALVPDRLAYQEFVPDEQRYRSTPDDPAAEALCLGQRLEDLIIGQPIDRPTYLSWTQLKSRYERLLFPSAPAGSAV